uniref:Cell division cycle protein 123 n=2 Tax=Lygus hesperus TaxID=30085 RepID=A0A146LCB1_LYGHE
MYMPAADSWTTDAGTERTGSLATLYDTRPYIVLLKWSNLFPSREFRIFVVHNLLVGITQRDLVMYEELQSSRRREEILGLISNFHRDVFSKHFTSTTSHCCYDIYIDKFDTVFIIDVSALHTDCTDGVLFSLQDELLPLTALDPLTEPFMRHLHQIRNSRYLRPIFEDCGDGVVDSEVVDGAQFLQTYVPTSLHCIPFRVVTGEHEREGHRRAIVQSTALRLPSDNINLSDSHAIEAFIASQSATVEEDGDSDGVE